MASELKKSPKGGTESELAMKAVEDALNEGIFDDAFESDAPESAGSLESDVSLPEAGETAEVEFDPDFDELERKLSLAANDLREQSAQNDAAFAESFSPDFDNFDADDAAPAAAAKATTAQRRCPCRPMTSARCAGRRPIASIFLPPTTIRSTSLC